MNVSKINTYASKWLSAADLNGKTRTVRIENVVLENVRQADGTQEQKLILDFVGASKRLILNKSQFNAMRQIAGDESDHWFDVQIMLSPATSNTGKPTIQILAVPVVEEDEAEIPF